MLSGGERIVVEILKHHSPMTIVLPNWGAWLVFKELHCNYRFVRIPFNSNNKYLIFINWIVLSFKSCKSYEEDVITSGDFFCNTLPAFFSRRKWTAYLFHIIPRKRLVSYLMQQFSLQLMRRADTIVVLNSLVKDYLVSRGFKNKIHIQEVEIDEKAIKKVKEQVKIYEACYMGRLSPSKGIFDLPKIWQGMKGKLLVIGNGFAGDVRKLKSLCSENVIFVGYKEGEEKFKLIKKSKVFISPSYEEGLSLTIKEVLACGVPIIAWDLPVYKELYPNKLKTIPIGNIEKFREALCEC
jgi:glycosyltransferase involved in cell wall biosynthesis